MSKDKNSPETEKEFGDVGEDNICDQCDSTGEVEGQLCKACGGKGYVTS